MSKKQMYYLGKPCELLYKISDVESLIEIPSYLLFWREQCSWDEYPEPDYCEPEMTKIIVLNKYLSEESLKIEEYIESKITNKVKEYQQEIEKIKKIAYEERSKILSEIKTLEDTKKNLKEKYKDFPLIDDAISLVMQDDEYYIEYSTWYPKLLKSKDFIYDKEVMKAVVIRRDLRKYGKNSKVFIRLNQYSDGSGSNGNQIIPAKNLKEAQSIFIELIDEAMKERGKLTTNFIKIADELMVTNEHIEKYRCQLRKEERYRKIEKIEKAENELKKMKEELKE